MGPTGSPRPTAHPSSDRRYAVRTASANVRGPSGPLPRPPPRRPRKATPSHAPPPVRHLAGLARRRPRKALNPEHPHELSGLDRGQRFVLPIGGRPVKAADRRLVRLPHTNKL